MGTLKMISKKAIAKTPEQALEILCGDGNRITVMYSSDEKVLQEMIDKVYEGIRLKNKSIPDINDQILPTTPYMWRDIDGCLGVVCVEISADVFSKSAECIHLFTEPKYDVLTDPLARKPLSSKALTSMALIGHLMKELQDKNGGM